ncbi:MAG: M16 family metallopeptidase [Caulobacteraceae bacterium]
MLLLVAAPALRADVFNPETFTLANGMQVVVVPNHRVPVVTHMVWYRVGAANEPAGQSGVAHLLEHLMFKGTDTVAPGEFSRMVARHGGQENAFTSYHYTSYFQNVAKDRLEQVMMLEADRMGNLALTPEQIETERQVVIEERRQRVDNNPAATLAELRDVALYMNAEYRRPVIGFQHEIEALTPDEITAFYRRWYVPNNAILVVGGDITVDELRPLAEKSYGVLEAEPVPDDSVRMEPPHHAPRRVVMRDAKVGQPMWSRAWLAPSYMAGLAPDFAPDRDREAYPLQVAAEVLGGGPVSVLYRRLVIEQQLAVSAGASYDPTMMGQSRFSVSASPRPGVTIEGLEAAVDAVLADVMETGFVPEDVEQAKRRMQADAFYARDSLGAGANILGRALATGLAVADVEAWPERIAAVSPEAAHTALIDVLEPKRSVTAHLLPLESHREARR